MKDNPGLSGFHFLSLGTDALAARLALIDVAESSIDAQYYIWHDDLTGRFLHVRLLQAADRGVRVRLLLDDLDTAGKEDTLFALDAHPNIEIRLYNPFKYRSFRMLDFLTNPSRINRRMHNKSLTVDNQASILGGRNIGDEYFGANEDVAFGDLDVLAVGPVVRDVSSTFDLYWNSHWAIPVAAYSTGSFQPESLLANFRIRSETYEVEARQSPYKVALEDTLILQYKGVEELPMVWSRWVLVSDNPDKPKADKVLVDTHLAPRLKEAFDQAQEDLIIISPYFVPGDDVVAYLIDKVMHGVRVRILTNSLAANDVSMVHAGYMNYREDLLKGGVELFEFKKKTNDIAVERGKSGWSGSSRASLHAKSFVFDETYVFVGSFNLDPRSIKLNTELGVYFEGSEFAAHFTQAFDEKILKKAYRVELIDGKLVWTTVENDKLIRLDKEPETSWWTRFSTKFLSAVIPESLL